MLRESRLVAFADVFLHPEAVPKSSLGAEGIAPYGTGSDSLDALFANNAPITPGDVIASLHRAWAVGLQGDDAWRWQHVEAIVRLGERSIGRFTY